MNIKEYLNKKSSIIEEYLSFLVTEKKGPFRSLFEAARYSLLSGGKRIRPILTLATVETLGGNTSIALSPACALEMIHTYSLIHDDLPCMDNDDFRRGKPTLHKAFNEGLAVLTGDFLLTEAFGILSKVDGLTPIQKIELIKELAGASGGDGMIAGQVMDIESSDGITDLSTLEALHGYKTGALITASIKFGSIIGNASLDVNKILMKFAKNLGLAFQIVDDILDVTASEAKHGRSIATDILNGKATYVTLVGIENARVTLNNLHLEALNLLEKLPFNTSILSALTDYVINRDY